MQPAASAKFSVNKMYNLFYSTPLPYCVTKLEFVWRRGFFDFLIIPSGGVPISPSSPLYTWSDCSRPGRNLFIRLGINKINLGHDDVEKSWSTCVRLKDRIAYMALPCQRQILRCQHLLSPAPFGFVRGDLSYEGTLVFPKAIRTF
jgi:hypothetical protein